MKRGQIIALALAGTCCLGTMWAMSKMTKAPPPPPPDTAMANMVKVLVARNDIGLGTLTAESHFRWQEYPEAAVPQDVVKCVGTAPCSMREHANRIARVPIAKDEIITGIKLVKAGEGGVLASILPQGMRAISAKITEDSAVGKLILPNDHVDVLLSKREKNPDSKGPDLVSSEIILTNIRVLAIDQAPKEKDGTNTLVGKTVTLELKPEQAETLGRARQSGTLSLALRSLVDVKTVEVKADEIKRNEGVNVIRYGIASQQSIQK